jgi:hypothetical protein
MKVVDIDFQNTVIPYFRRAPPKRKTKHMALDGSTSASHALEPGSIPGRSNAYTFFRLPEIVSGSFVLLSNRKRNSKLK